MSQAAKKSTIPFTQADPRLAVGSKHSGFTITSVEPLVELGGTAYVMRHDASGARTAWLAIPDVNKSFAIAFRTPPADDTGVFHILEHSVLCGSDRFPVKEPFVNLLKTSMQTFLNALTFPDKTMYPVASTNTADLENLMDVYLDAVLHPAIYQRPRIFEQEGWHLELDSQEGPLSYNGVVYNEMKGALSDPDERVFMALNRALFPNTAYRFESGGDPASIPQLSYEKFIDAHARHYNLANSYTILYGDLDIERELAFISSRFDGAARRTDAAPNILTLQEPVRAGLTRIEMATAPENATVGLAYVIGSAAERERVLAADILLDALTGSNEAPLKRAVLDAGLGEEFSASLIDSELQPQVLFTLKGAKPQVAEEFRRLIESTSSRLAREGIGRERLSAALSQAEFNLREGDWGYYADGVALSMQVMSSWLYDDRRPVDYLRYQEPIDHMRSGLDAGYFEGLLRSLVCESTHNAEVELVPVEADDAEETLPALKEQLSTEQLQDIMDEVAALRAEQEAPDAPEDLAKLPRLTVQDIEPAAADKPVRQVQAPLSCLHHDLPTHRIDYVYHYFDLSRLTADDLPYVGILTELLGKLDTSQRSAADLDTVVEENLGNLSFFTDCYAKDDDALFALPLLVVGASSLSERVASLASLPAEVWGTTKFDDTSRIREVLQQRRVGLGQYFTNSGHAAAMGRLATHFSNASRIADRMGGIDFYLFLKDLLTHWEERKDALPKRLSEVSEKIFNADAATISFVGPKEDLDSFWNLAGTLGLSPYRGEGTPMLSLEASPHAHEAFVIPSDVCFVAEGGGRSPHDLGTNGAWQVAARALSYDYLWNEVRVKGGAYGVGFRRTLQGLRLFWSYRDPSLDATLKRFEGASQWLSSWQGSPEELDGYIVSCVAAHDAPAKARQLARRQDGEHFLKRPSAWRDEQRQQILDSSAKELRAMGAALADLPRERCVCAFGPREALEQSDIDFKIVELMGEEHA